MKTSTKQQLTFEQFLEQCPEEGLYELVDGFRTVSRGRFI